MPGFTDYAEAVLLDYAIATLGDYVALHCPLVLNADVLAGAGQIQLDKNDDLGNAFTPVQGDKIVIGTEQHYVGTVTDNTTYWTVALVDADGAAATLAAGYSAGAFVGYAGETTMPTEMNYSGYARQQAPNATHWAPAVQGNPTTKTTTQDVTFPDPPADVRAGSFSINDASVGGNRIVSDVLDGVAAFQAAVTDPGTLQAGSLTITLD